MKWRGFAETLFITLAALIASMAIFGAFISLYAGKSPLVLYRWMYVGAFGNSLAWQRTLTAAAPFLLTALCTALPIRLGLIIIGGEGALAAGALAATAVGVAWPDITTSLGQNPADVPVLAAHLAMGVTAALAGGLVIMLAGALSHWRGVNATISSLLIAYICLQGFKFLVEGPMRDLENYQSLNTPSTYPLAKAYWIGKIPGLGVHWGLVYGIVFCVVAYILMFHTTFGFAAQMTGGNVRAAQACGLPVGRLVLVTCLLAGAAAGLAGMLEITAVHHQANANVLVGYGFTGILVSFIARHHPLGIIPAAVLFGALDACGGKLQKYLLLPDASVKVLMGIMFVMILLFETLYGRFRWFQSREVREAMAP